MKQIILMRKDLKMTRGKEVAQGAHASLALTLANLTHPNVVAWLADSFTKVCLSVDSEDELNSLCDSAESAGLLVQKIIDNGATEFHGVKTLTCAAIGPATHDDLSKITGHLKLR